jgi:hypothetical protein
MPYFHSMVLMTREGSCKRWETYKVWEKQVNRCCQKSMEKNSVSRKYEPISEVIPPNIFAIDNWFHFNSFWSGWPFLRWLKKVISGSCRFRARGGCRRHWRIVDGIYEFACIWENKWSQCNQNQWTKRSLVRSGGPHFNKKKPERLECLSCSDWRNHRLPHWIIKQFKPQNIRNEMGNW